MNSEELLNLITYIKTQIFNILNDTDHLNETESNKMLLNINQMFNDLGLAVNEVLPPEIAKSYFNAVDEATQLLTESGMKIEGQAVFNGVVSAQFKSKVHTAAVMEINSDTMLDMAGAIRTAKENFNMSYQKTLQQVNKEITDGLVTGSNREYIIKKVREAFIEDGFTAFTTVDKKKLPLDFYSRTVVRTKIRTAKNHGNLNRYKEAGINLVYVTGREPTCAECAKYRNKVFSVDGSDKRFPHIDVYKLFPRHPNCNCLIRPFVIKYKTQEEINQAVDEAKSFNPNIDPRAKKQREAYKKDQDKKRIARQEDKEFINMKLELGGLAPKSIGDYRNIKRNNPERYNQLLNDMFSIKSYNKKKTQAKVFEMKRRDIELLREIGKDWASSLTDEESKAIYNYTGTIHSKLNEYLISDSYDKELEELSDNISSGLQKFKLEKPITVFRGISKSEYLDIITSDVINIFQSFKSTSIDKDIAKDFPENSVSAGEYILKLKVPVKSSGAYIEFNSELDYEMEYLLDKGTRYIINTQESDFNNNFVVLEVLENDN